MRISRGGLYAVGVHFGAKVDGDGGGWKLRAPQNVAAVPN